MHMTTRKLAALTAEAREEKKKVGGGDTYSYTDGQDSPPAHKNKEKMC
jgi:hypothetical protein